MLGCKLLHINESQACEGGEDKNIADYGNALQRELLIVYGEQFIHCQELTYDFFLMELDTDERVFGNPFVGKGKVGYLLQTFHVADNRVLLAGLFRLEVKLKGTYQLTVNFCQRQILLIIFQLDKFRQIPLATFIAADCD